MLSNHFPFVYGHEDAWLALCAFVALGAYVRHFFNLRHRGRTAWSIPVISVLAVIGLALWLQPADEKPAAPAGPPRRGGQAGLPQRRLRELPHARAMPARPAGSARTWMLRSRRGGS